MYYLYIRVNHCFIIFRNIYWTCNGYKCIFSFGLNHGSQVRNWTCATAMTILNLLSYMGTPVLFVCLFFWFLRPHPQHIEVPRRGVESVELYSVDYATATVAPDPSHISNLHHSSLQTWILNSLSEARDWTCILMDPSHVHYRWAIMGLLSSSFFFFFFFFFWFVLSHPCSLAWPTHSSHGYLLDLDNV